MREQLIQYVELLFAGVQDCEDIKQEILQNTLRDKLVLDLTGCTTDEVLFYVSNGAAVFAMTDTNTAENTSTPG